MRSGSTWAVSSEEPFVRKVGRDEVEGGGGGDKRGVEVWGGRKYKVSEKPHDQ